MEAAMPAITVDNPLVLPRVPRPAPGVTVDRPVRQVVASSKARARAAVSRSLGPSRDRSRSPESDPFLLLDHVGPLRQRTEEARGAPWHPHRGFEDRSPT